jgi:hypothetical protein
MNQPLSIEEKTLANFITLLNEASNDSKIHQNLKILEERLAETEDDAIELAMTIQNWYEEFKIDFSEEKLAPIRANMLKKGETIPKQPEGNSPRVIYNKALLVEEVNKAIAARSNDKT